MYRNVFVTVVNPGTVYQSGKKWALHALYSTVINLVN